MRTDIKLALCVLLLVAAGCDKNGANDTTSANPATEQSASDDDPAERGKSSSGARAGEWKAHDVHTHLSPMSYPIALRLMDQNDLYRVVNMSGGSSPDYREKHLELADEHPGRIALFSNIDWSTVDAPDFGESAANTLDEAIGIGFAGLKIAKSLGLGVRTEDGELLEVDDRRLDPVWEKAGELGVVVGIHTGDPKAFFEKPGPQNERHAELELAPSWSFYGDEYPSREALLAARDRVVERHPDTTFMLLHFGNNPEDIDYVDRLLDENPNVVVDVSARIAEIGRHDPEKVRKLFIKHQDRILFATDLSVSARPTNDNRLQYRLTLGSISKEPPTLEDVKDFYDKHWRYFESDAEAIDHPVPIQGDWKVHPIELPDEVLEKVYWKNGERLIFAPWLGRRAAHDVARRAVMSVEE